MPVIAVPHPDLELGVPRLPLGYAVELPGQGISAQTGVILYIHGYGQRVSDEYTGKLLRHLADEYDCVAVCVDYHGAVGLSGCAVAPAEDFFAKLAEHHDVRVNTLPADNIMGAVEAIGQALAAHGVRYLHDECHLVRGPEAYINFGLLPALDNLQVLADVLRLYPVDRRRIFALGTSYGGYVALLMAKFAPNTFRMVIDNSGFSSADDSLGVVFGSVATRYGVEILMRCPIAFSRDPESPNFFGPSRQAIRDLAQPDHYRLTSTTVVYSYHSATDVVAPTDRKIQMVATAARNRRHDLRLITAAHMDGRLFKTTDHGMRASMRLLFALSYGRWQAETVEQPAITDFDLETVHALTCAGQPYTFAFSPAGVRLSIA